MEGGGLPDSPYDPGSFRDPASRVRLKGDRVLRVLTANGMADWEALASTRFFAREVAAGRLIATEAVPEADWPQGARGMLSHARIPFWSYPYEWSFSMLKAAALLHLELLQGALAEGLTMKDATPYNIAFRGASPVFIDIGSFRPYEQGEPWLGYNQFCRMFLYPLMMRAHGDIAFQGLLRGSLEGIPADHVRSVIRGARVMRAGAMLDVVLQARAERSLASSNRDLRRELGSAGFSIDMIRSNIKRLRALVEKTDWRPRASTWSDYNACAHVSTQRGLKESFVGGIVDTTHRSLVWDLGANDGHFSRMAARNADLVVAADSDEVVIDRLFRSLAGSGPGNVLPLVFDLADPSPGLGWRGQERRRLEQRTRPDLVLFLAVIHHLVVSANLPLAEVIDWLATLEAEVVFEWVPPNDTMARRITVNKRPHEVHPDYNEESLRALLRGRFEIRSEAPLEQRTLFHLTPLP